MLLAKAYVSHPTLLYGCKLFSSCDSVSRTNPKLLITILLDLFMAEQATVEYLSSHIKSILYLLKIH